MPLPPPAPRPFDVVVGLDVSLTDTGFVILEYVDNNWKETHVESITTDPDSEDHLRQASIVNAVFLTLHQRGYDPARTAVCIEDYGTSKFQGKLHERIEICGALKYALLTVFGFPVFAATPSAVKKFMGHGGKKKEEMIQAAANTFKFRHTNHNVVDAYCCARYLIANRGGTRLTIRKASPILSLNFLQTPASSRGPKVAISPLTKNLRRPNLKLATRHPA